MSKQLVTDLARKFNCETHYQGSTKIMFVHGTHEDYKKFLNELLNTPEAIKLDIEISHTTVWPVPVKEEEKKVAYTDGGIYAAFGKLSAPPQLVADEVGKFESDPASGLNRSGLWQEAARSGEPGVTFIDPTQAVTNEIPKTQPVSFDLAKAEAQVKMEFSKEERALLDKFLVENPIDRKQKGCYIPAAEKFNVDVEYVRDRYRKLRAKGLVEKDLSATPA